MTTTDIAETTMSDAASLYRAAEAFARTHRAKIALATDRDSDEDVDPDTEAADFSLLITGIMNRLDDAPARWRLDGP